MTINEAPRRSVAITVARRGLGREIAVRLDSDFDEVENPPVAADGNSAGCKQFRSAVRQDRR